MVTYTECFKNENKYDLYQKFDINKRSIGHIAHLNDR